MYLLFEKYWIVNAGTYDRKVSKIYKP